MNEQKRIELQALYDALPDIERKEIEAECIAFANELADRGSIQEWHRQMVAGLHMFHLMSKKKRAMAPWLN